MFEKILQKMKEQREKTSNVSDRTLEDLARTYEAVITTDELLETSDFSKAIKSIDGNLNSYTADAIKKLNQSLKNPEGEKSKKQKKDNESGGTDSNPVLEAIQGLTETVTTVVSRMDALQNGQIATTRKEQLKKTLKDLPDSYAKPILSSFDRMNFENDDDFNSFLTETTSSRDSFVQDNKEKGIVFGTPKTPKKEEKTGETGELSDARKILADSKKDN